MKASTKFSNLISSMKDDIKTQDETQKRCDIRIKELQHRQDCLFKVLGATLIEYESLGFRITFTGEHEMFCRTNDKDEGNDHFNFLVPAFNIIYKPKNKNYNGGQMVEMNTKAINFSPKVNGAGAINFNFNEIINNKDSQVFGYISWQVSDDEKDKGYWIVNAGNADLSGVILSYEEAVKLFAFLTY